MAKQSTVAPLHSNPNIAKAMAANDREKYPSMEAWGKAHNLTANERRAARQVLRDAGLGVGRGRTYKDSTTPKVKAAAKKAATSAKQTAQAAEADTATAE